MLQEIIDDYHKQFVDENVINTLVERLERTMSIRQEGKAQMVSSGEHTMKLSEFYREFGNYYVVMVQNNKPITFATIIRKHKDRFLAVV